MEKTRDQAPMRWITPKLDWTENDPFDLERDYLRIRQNLLYLQWKAAKIVNRPEYTRMGEYSITEMPMAEFFNAVETNLARAEQMVQDNGYKPRRFEPGDFVWNWEDLNRIETLEMKLYSDLAMIENGQQMLAFCLGGGVLGAFIS